MKIICLSGYCNSGKTNTLNWLIKILIEEKGFALVLPESGISLGDPKYLRTDHNVILKDKNGTMIVGITTGGDTETVIARNISFIEGHCDVWITATRSRGETINRVEKYVADATKEMIKKGNPVRINIKKITKRRGGETTAEQDKENEQQAREIVALLGV